MKKIIAVLCLIFAPVLAHGQTWQYTASMNVIHWDAGMIELDDHTAMMVGGFDANVNPIATCEIYNPATATWSLTGDLNVPRAYACLIKLANGHILSISGSTSTYGTASDAVEEYNPALGTWAIVGHLQMQRMVPTANLLNDGRILIAGGYNGYTTLSTCELYDPQSNTSVMTGSTHINFYEHQSTMLNDGRVMVNGGRDGGAGSNYFNGTEIYDPSTGIWTVVSSMAQSRMEAITTTFSDGAVLAAGGRNAPGSSAPGSEIFDMNTLTWSNTDPLKEPVCWMGCIPFPDDRYMVTGGIITGSWIDLLGLDNVTTPKCEWYDRVNRLWYYAPELNLSRCRHRALYLHQEDNQELPTDFLLVAGGRTGTVTMDSNGNMYNFSHSFTNTAEILDVTQPALKAYMKLPVNGGSASVRTTSENNINFSASYMSDGSIKINYLLASDDNVKIDIMSIDGRTSKRIMNSSVNNGAHSIIVPMNDLTAGAYFMHFSTSSVDRIFKFIVR